MSVADFMGCSAVVIICLFIAGTGFYMALKEDGIIKVIGAFAMLVGTMVAIAMVCAMIGI